MAYKDIKAGKYIARALNGQWGESSEKKTKGVAINLQLKGFPDETTIWWKGWLTDGTMERTMDALAIMGYSEELPITTQDQTFGKEHLADREFEVVIELEADKKDPTILRPVAKWINQIGGGKFGGIGAAQGNVLAGIDLRAEMAAARARTGASKAQPGQTQALKDEDVPF